jgi:hypothetical protein
MAALLIRSSAPPTKRRVIIVCAGVDHAALNVVVRQVGLIGFAAKGKL